MRFNAAHLLVAATAPAALAFPAGGWQLAQLIPDGAWITDISFLEDGLHGMVSSDHGYDSYIFHTADGGLSWDAARITNCDINAACMTSADTAWAVGDDGQAFISVDGGETWMIRPLGTARNLEGIQFVSPSLGWIVGGGNEDRSHLVLATSDGGASWMDFSFGSDCISTYCVSFTDPLNGWIGGRSTDGPHVYRTTDGGCSWTRQTLPALPTGTSIRSISFANPSEGWAATYHSGFDDGAILHTQDGGLNWDVQHYTLRQWNSVDALDELNVIALGAPLQAAFVTSDGGANWQEYATGPDAGTAVEYVGSRLWAGGDDSEIIASDNGGISWNNQLITLPLYSISWADQNTGWAVAGSSHLELTLRSTDGGLTWTPQQGSPGGSVVQFLDPDRGWMLWPGNSPTVWSTADGGSSWSPHPAGYSSQGSTDGMFFLSPDSGWVFGEHGIVRRTTDGGISWVTQPTGITAEINDLVFATPTEGWICGIDDWEGFIRHTSDGGLSWQSQYTGSSLEEMQALYFLNGSTGWAVHVNGVLKTVDGGAVWTSLGGMGAIDGASIVMVSDMTGWIHGGGSTGRIWRTDDGGMTWSLDWDTPIGAIRSDITLTPDGYPWICGDHMMIARWLPSTGLEDLNARVEAPSGRISICPNPSTALVALDFTLSGSGEASLTIFDISGRTVYSSSLGELPAGSSQVLVEASNYPSGLYICAIRSQMQVLTGSMLVIK